MGLRGSGLVWIHSYMREREKESCGSSCSPSLPKTLAKPLEPYKRRLDETTGENSTGTGETMTLFRLPFSRRSPSAPSSTSPAIPEATDGEPRHRRHRARSIFLSAPNVGPRESSLYLPPTTEPEFASGLPTQRPQTEPNVGAGSSTFDIPQTAFFDTQAHTGIWDELFDSAAHTTKARVDAHQQSRKRLVSSSVLGLNMPAAIADSRVGALMDRALRSEIWSKVRQLFDISSGGFPIVSSGWGCGETSWAFAQSFSFPSPTGSESLFLSVLSPLAVVRVLVTRSRAEDDVIHLRVSVR